MPLPALVISLLFTQGAVAQQTAVTIRDLTRPPAEVSEPALPVGMLDRGTGGEDSWNLLGLEDLAHAAKRRYSSDLLLALVADLSGIPQRALSEAAGEVLVSDQHAAAARTAVDQLRALAVHEDVELEFRLERKLPSGWSLLASGTRFSRSGQLVRLSDTVVHRKLTDFDVEIAQSSAIGDPVVSRVGDGSAILARARVVPGSEFAIVEAALATCTSTPGQKLDLGSEQLGELDRILTEQIRSGLAFVLERGKTTEHEWTDVRGRQLRLSVRGSWTPASLDPAQTLVATSLLGERTVDFRWRPGPVDGEEDLDARPTRLDLVPNRIRSANGAQSFSDYWDSASAGLRVFRFPDGIGAHRQKLEQLLADMRRSFRLELEIVACKRDHELEPGSSLSEGARRIAFLVTELLSDHTASFVTTKSTSHIRDWNVEVAESSRIADPVIAIVSEGTWIAARGMVHPKSRSVELNLRIRLQQCDWDDPLLVRMSGDVLAPGRISPEDKNMAGAEPKSDPTQSAKPVPRKILRRILPAVMGRVERPILKRKSLEYELTMERGKERVFRGAAPTLLEPDEELRIRIRVR